MPCNDTEVSEPQWEAVAQSSSVAVDAMVVLGALTFALQLCLVLYFLFRCWRLDHKVQNALKEKPLKPHAADLNFSTTTTMFPVVSSQSRDIYYEPLDPYYGPSIPWDLVQG